MDNASEQEEEVDKIISAPDLNVLSQVQTFLSVSLFVFKAFRVHVGDIT